MLVRILQPQNYSPTANDSMRCYGQLRMRSTDIAIEETAADGTKSIRKKCGPMVLYFPKGATPELPEDVAQQFIAAGIAEQCDLAVQYVARDVVEGMAFAP